MKTVIALTRRDLFWFNLVMQPRLSTNWKYGVWMVAMAIGFFVYDMDEPLTVQEWIYYVGLIVASLLAFVVIGNVLFALYAATSAKPNDGVVGNHEYEVRPDGFYEKTAAGDALTKWTAISRIGKERTCIFVELAGQMMHILPRHSFRSEAAYAAFYLALERAWKAAQRIHPE